MTKSHRVKYDAEFPIGPQPNLNRLRRAQRITRHKTTPVEIPVKHKFRYKVGKTIGQVIKILLGH